MPFDGDGTGECPNVDALPWGAELYESEPTELPLIPLFDCPTGRLACEECEEPERQFGGTVIANVKLANRFIRLLRWHGCTVYAPKTDVHVAPPPVRFTHPSGADGLVMTMSMTPDVATVPQESV
jgi:hypothetical protein